MGVSAYIEVALMKSHVNREKRGRCDVCKALPAQGFSLSSSVAERLNPHFSGMWLSTALIKIQAGHITNSCRKSFATLHRRFLDTITS